MPNVYQDMGGVQLINLGPGTNSNDGATIAQAGGETALPAGLIVMWNGLLANIPDGWVLCDGNNGTPDLRSKFVRGAASDPGSTGGGDTHTHTYSGVVNHTHTITVTDPGHTHGQSIRNTGTAGIVGTQGGNATNTATAGTTASATTGITAVTANPAGGVAQGTTSAGSTLPAYYALAFIMKT